MLHWMQLTRQDQAGACNPKIGDWALTDRETGEVFAYVTNEGNYWAGHLRVHSMWEGHDTYATLDRAKAQMLREAARLN